MKNLIIVILFIPLLVTIMGCTRQKSQNEMERYISDLMSKMTVEEKIGQLNLVAPMGFTQTGPVVSEDVEKKIKEGKVGAILNSFTPEITRKTQELAVNESPNKIPLIMGMDVIHGYKTIFPIPLALSCTWDMDLIREMARLSAMEASSQGINWTYSPMVDIARDARWGRISEGSGEDPWLGSRIAEAMIKGYQGDDLTKNNTLMACVKHFALYGAGEAGRDYNTVDMSRISMYQDFLPPYKAAIDAGAGSVMSSFNVVDGIPATGNKWLLTDLLRNQWEFTGFVVSDYTSVNEMIPHGMGDLPEVSALALKAGLDMDMVGEGFLNTLKKSLDEGKITEKMIDDACRRVLEAKYKLGLFEDPFRYLSDERLSEVYPTEAHLKASREIAARSMVLLKNDKGILPLKKSGTIALVGPLADNEPDMLGTWVLVPDMNHIVSVREGITNVAGNDVKVIYAKGANITDDPYLKRTTRFSFGPQRDTLQDPSPEVLLREAVTIAKKADVIVAVLGESAAMSGEAASRTDIDIPESQKKLLRELVSTGKPVVLVLVNGRPLTLVWENRNVDAILEAWAGGTEAGNAIADVLFGNYNPGGKLTATFPRNVGQIPLYYNHKNTGRPMDERNKFTSKYLDSPNDPLYPFGYGLSYTSFGYSEISVNKDSLKGNDELLITVQLTNTGNLSGEEVVQLYIQDPVASVSRSVKELKNFKKIKLDPGESQAVQFKVTTKDLKFYNPDLVYDWEPGEFVVMVGTNSRDVKSKKITWMK